MNLWPECSSWYSSTNTDDGFITKWAKSSKNHIMHYAMASNISGVIGSAVAAGVLISFLS